MSTPPVSVLYVDDELNNLTVFVAAFRRYFTVYTARSASEGLAVLKNHPVQVVLADQLMPDMSGIQFLEAVRAEDPHIIRMILTGFADMDTIIEGIYSGKVHRYITKPWDEQELKVTLDSAVKTYYSEKQSRERIQDLENQLLKQERLASMGMLIASIAHEINNPINFITANIKSLKKDITDVLQVIKQYSQITASSINDLSAFKDAIDKIHSFKEEVGLDYTIEEIDKLLTGLEEGAQRTATIVKGLRTFSRSDDKEMTSTDILEGIDSTLILLSSSYKDRIEIVKEYEEIPSIDCYPGKLNQVFMNILSNAIQAIKEKGKIYIRVSKGLNTVQISIRDTGEGIKEVNKSKIFIPFFTTKGSEQGTGLGLSISNNIILEHHGTIAFNSEEEKGTEFIITLPIKQPIKIGSQKI